MPSPPPEASADGRTCDVEDDVLHSIVRDVFGPSATIEATKTCRVRKRIINGTTRGLRFVDVAVTAGEVNSSLALVVKSIAAPSAEESDGIDPRFRATAAPQHYNYWLREALVYRDPPRTAPALRLPRCYAIAAGELRRTLYLERVPEPVPNRPAAAFEAVVRSIGHMQATYARSSLPAWSSIRTLRAFTPDPAPAALSSLPSSLAALAARARDLLASRDAGLAELETASERTLCHHDLWATNVSTALGDTVVFDWSMAGDGTLGEDVANLVFDDAWMLEISSATFDELRDVAPDWYLDGLRDGGWRGDAAAVRSTIERVAALRFGLLLGALGRYVRDATDLDAIDVRYGVPAGEVATRRSHVVAAALRPATSS